MSVPMTNQKISRIERALDALESIEACCTLCPRECRVDRRRERTGICRSGRRADISSALLHFGEEPVLSGSPDGAEDALEGNISKRGSGTIFFAGCNLKCLFCQNYQISWLHQGREIEDEELAEIMLGLERQGATNINLVSPTHLVLPILRALRIAFGRGLDIPLVYNTNGYEKTSVIEHLAGIVDIYLPDLKYHSSEVSKRYSGAADYFFSAAPAIQEMYVQQPDLELDAHGAARQGLIIRHLILPGHTDDSLAVLDWIARKLPLTTAISLMSQYRPCHLAPEELRRSLSTEEYRRVTSKAKRLGFENLFLQPGLFAPDEHLVPDFDRPQPFRWKT
jgi:putative pyruvate formate lyase activating enzyme